MATMFSSGEGYEGMMGRHSKKLALLFADFVQVRDRGSLLDVGCGTGSLTQVLTHRTHDTDSNRASDALLSCNEAPPFISLLQPGVGPYHDLEVSASYRK